MAGRAARAALVTALFAGALAAAPAARAEVTITPSYTVIEVAGGPGDDRIAVRCERDRLVVNGQPALNGRVRCSRLAELEVEGRRGDDRISVRDLGTFRDLFEDETLEPVVTGGPGNDRVFIETWAVVAGFMGPGDDRYTSIRGGGGGAVGGLGDDRLHIGGRLFGGELVGGAGADHLTVSGSFSYMLGGPGPDRIRSFKGTAMAFGAEGADTMSGGEDRDLLIGGDGRDLIRGQNGTDLLAGRLGRDRLFGGYAPDLLVGGRGRDLLDGGRGRDAEAQAGVPRDLGPLKRTILALIFRAILSPGPDVVQEEEASNESAGSGYAPLGSRRAAFSALLERGHRQPR